MIACSGRDALILLGFTAVATTLVFLSALPHRALFVWNATGSAPVGLYFVVPRGALVTGDLVLVTPPFDAEQLAVQRGYLGANVPLVKHVGGLAGDWICTAGMRVSINGRPAAIRLARDTAGRALPGWTGCRRLRSDEVFLLNGSVPQSFDSRYFGPVSRNAVQAVLRPLWVR